MNNKKFKYQYRLLLVLIGVALVSLGFMGDDKNGSNNKPTTVYKTNATQEGGKYGDAYRLNINNINLPLNRKGIIAAVNLTDPNPAISGAGGKFGGHVFLFSGGFFLSGFANGNLWANAVASASLVEDYTHGTVASGESDPRAQIYVLKAGDPAFGQSWQDWKDAVDLGADFYDGDGDGQYNPVDKNGNLAWDTDEDRPDLLGDELAWTVYNDGIPAAQRRWNTIDPLGIEVRQSVFAFASSGAIGNLIFVRYRIKYVGLGGASEPDQLDDVYFGAWADPDLGTATNDLVGIDVPRNAGYTYQTVDDGPDGYGNQPPCFMIDFFSGPQEYIPGTTFVDNDGDGIYTDGVDTPIDTAYSSRGQIIGRKVFPGARNQPVSSFVQYINGDPFIRDPNNATEARNYSLGLDLNGGNIDPCNWAYGTVAGGVDCSTIDPRFWYSGDPVANNGAGLGWIATQQADIRQMTNTGPFTLKKNEEKEIVVAYVVGQGSDPLNSVTVARSIDDGAQTIFDLNFLAPSAPPAPEVTVQSSEDFIDLIWETPDQLNYRNIADTWDIKFGGYNVYAFKTFNSGETVNNQQNRVLFGRYQVDNFINNLYFENGETGGIELLYQASPEENRLDSNLYKDPATGRIRLRIDRDPFTNGKLIKGQPYYFLVTSYGVNHDPDVLINRSGGNFGDFGDYYLSSQTFVQAVENPISLNLIRQVVFGQDLYAPPLPVVEGSLTQGKSAGQLQYDPIDKDALTGDTYAVNFIIDSSTTNYSVFWKLTNQTTNTLLIDSAKYFLYGSKEITVPPTDGFIVKLSDETPRLDTIYGITSQPWWDAAVYYLATDLGDQSRRLPGGGNAIQNLNTDYVKADKLRRVVIDFSQPGKAYRYLNGYVGAVPPLYRRSYLYAGGVTADNPDVNSAITEIGQIGVGYMDVPFSVFIEDSTNGILERRQLACAVLERRVSEGGNPDGIWDPGTNVNQTGEFIFILNSDYDPNGGQLEYTGNFPASSTVWADLKGYDIPADANATAEQRAKAISPFFDVLYVAGISKLDASTFYANADKFEILVDTYPYTPADEFRFTTNKGGLLSTDAEKSLFEKVNVYPNPLLGYNPATGYSGTTPADEPFVTFTNLPNEQITIKIFSLSGQLLRTLTKDPTSTSPFLNWDLENESGLRVASGLYIAIVSSPSYGDKVLKFSIIMPQKQLPRF